jgi:hypothetical protein
MNMLKQLLLLFVVSLPMLSQASNAGLKVTIDLPSKSGGTYQSMGKMLADGLEDLGYDVDLVLSGNCATTVRNMQQQDRPLLTFWGNRLHLQDNQECAMPEPNDIAFVGLLTNSPEYLCSVGPAESAQDFFQLTGKVTLSVQPFPWQTDKMTVFLKTNSKAEVRTAIYRNTGAQKTAAVARETDFMIGTSGLKLQENGLVSCQYNTGNRVVENTRPLSSAIPGAMQSWMTQYARAQNFTPAQLATLREDFRKIVQRDDWQKFMSGLRFDTMQDRGVSQQLEFVIKSIQDLR